MTTPTIETLEQARHHVAQSSCGGCGKSNTLFAFEVRKEGPNRGRLFAKCRHCGHFGWLTPAASADDERDRAEASATPCPKCGKARQARNLTAALVDIKDRHVRPAQSGQLRHQQADRARANHGNAFAMLQRCTFQRAMRGGKHVGGKQADPRVGAVVERGTAARPR